MQCIPGVGSGHGPARPGLVPLRAGPGREAQRAGPGLTDSQNVIEIFQKIAKFKKIFACGA